MKTFFEQIGHAAFHAMIFIAVATIIVVSTSFGGKTLFRNIGDTASAQVTEDAFSTSSGAYTDTTNSKSLAGVSSSIELKAQPTKGQSISYSDFLVVKEGTNEVPFSIVSVTNYESSKDALKENQVALDKTAKTITFMKRGTYRIKVRANGTSITRKYFVITIR